jgi:drug/metabolite transporter superfamily protein YnfA
VHSEIPPFPLLIALAIAAAGWMVWLLLRHGALTVPPALLVVTLCVYGVGVLRSVLLPFIVAVGAGRDDLPDGTVFVVLVPFTDTLEDPSGTALNILLFLPLGALAPFVLRRPSLLRVGLAGLLTSLAIELVQLAADVTISTGRIADVDDVLGNTVGALLGYGILLLLLLVSPLRRLAAAAAWPGRGGQLLARSGPSYRDEPQPRMM